MPPPPRSKNRSCSPAAHPPVGSAPPNLSHRHFHRTFFVLPGSPGSIATQRLHRPIWDVPRAPSASFFPILILPSSDSSPRCLLRQPHCHGAASPRHIVPNGRLLVSHFSPA